MKYSLQKSVFTTTLGAFAFILFSLSLTAQTVSKTSSPGAMIADDSYNGTQASMTCDVINIAGVPPGATIDNISVDIAASHTWVGDLTVKIVTPQGQVLGMMSRPGFSEPADDGDLCCGDNSDLLSSSSTNWKDGNPTSAEDMGNTLLNLEIVCQDDGFCTYSPFPDTAPGTDLATLASTVTDINGNWTLCIGDSAVGDLGEFTSWTLTIDYSGGSFIPTLGEWGLIILALTLLVFSTVAIRYRQSIFQPRKSSTSTG